MSRVLRNRDNANTWRSSDVSAKGTGHQTAASKVNFIRILIYQEFNSDDVGRACCRHGPESVIALAVGERFSDELHAILRSHGELIPDIRTE